MATPQSVAAPPGHARKPSLGAKSEKSHRSTPSANKLHLTESHEDKVKRNLHTKADPMLAMNEAQPMTVALEKSTLGSLREMQHKDQFGNIITDPDRSNPTRPRLERPLDTIRSFEAAIYGSSSSRPVSYAKTEEPTGEGAYSRRSSYFGGGNVYRYSEQSAYYNGRGQSYSRPVSYVENYGNGQSSDHFYPYNQGGGRSRRPPPRMNAEQVSYGGNGPNGYAQNGYAQNGYGRSNENMATPSGSGTGPNTDPWGNSTDPSSVNSSLDQLQQQQQQQQQQQHQKVSTMDYGFQFGPTPNLDPNPVAPSGRINLGSTVPATDPNAGGPVGGPPAAAAAPTRRHLRKSINNASETSDSKSDTKRRSWFKRRFSKD